MKILVGILFVVLMGAGFARGNGDLPPPEPSGTLEAPPLGVMLCEKNGAGPRCLIAKASLERINAALDAAAEELARLEAENRKLREIKGCGKLDVMPKQQKAPEGRRS